MGLGWAESRCFATLSMTSLGTLALGGGGRNRLVPRAASAELGSGMEDGILAA